MEQKTDYTARSGRRSINEVVSGTKAEAALNGIGNLARSAEDLLNVTNNAVKLSFSAVGIVRNCQRRAYSNNNVYQKKQPVDTNYTASTEDNFYQSDNDNDYVFRCGEYYFPLSFSFTASGASNIVKSQLVDGIQIIENTYYEPQIIEMRIQMERRKADDTEGNDEMIFRKEQTYQMAKLGDFLNYIRKNQPVFEIYNSYLTDELGIQYCTLVKHSITPTQGSDITNVSLTLMEVDLTQQTLFV